MLDTFEILSSSGVVLWSRTYVPVSAHIVNSLIRDVFIEERTSTVAHGTDNTQKPTYRKEGHILKWTLAKDFGLIFVVSGRQLGLFVVVLQYALANASFY
jgi:signal recognition particle receptor subunit alpha